MKKIFLCLSVLLAGQAQAQTCIPTPDCAGLGYTETSCSGAFLRCPFDTSKMFCASSASGGGNSGGGATPESGGCLVGMIYYSDGSCSRNVDSSKTAIGVVVVDNEIIISKPKSGTMPWSTGRVDVSGVSNQGYDGDAKKDYIGKLNTAAIVAHFTSDTTSNNAAVYCNSYTTAGTSAGDWYLPAAGEIVDYVSGNYVTLARAFSKLGVSIAGTFWSSSEISSDRAWCVYSANGVVGSQDKITGNNLVICLLAL